MINFKLKNFDEINPVGQQSNMYLSWFWLTDGYLWLQFGEHTIYEYSNEAIQHFGEKTSSYSDYYIVRFLEDFTQIFEKISQPIPDNLYDLTKNIKQFKDNSKKWLAIYNNDDEDENTDLYYEQYDKLISWTHERLFDSGHLIGGPHLSFFRNKDKIRIVWDTEYILENGINLWSAKDGNIEMNFSDFVDEVKKFGHDFFKAMDKQIQLTIEKDWINIEVDKNRLTEEHQERKLEFQEKISLLEKEAACDTNWLEFHELYKRMINDVI